MAESSENSEGSIDWETTRKTRNETQEQETRDALQDTSSEESRNDGEKRDTVQREVTSSGERCFRFESPFNATIKQDGNVSSTDSIVDGKTKVTLRPSVLRVGKSDSSSVALESESKSEHKVFKFTPLSASRVISSSTDSTDTKANTTTSKTVNGSADEPSTSNAISTSLFTGLSHNQTSVVSSTTSSASREQGFVFGQNLQERVLLPDSSEESNGLDKNESAETIEKPANCSEKRKFEAITGEEGESNVLQIYCKLYFWESSTSSWKEKGKGLLRLNDKMKEEKFCSRLVMRTSGSLKVILNCIIVAGMKFELSNEQCLRFTNLDGIYLIKTANRIDIPLSTQSTTQRQSSSLQSRAKFLNVRCLIIEKGKDKDIEKLNSAIDCRLRELSKKHKTEENTEESAVKEVSNWKKTEKTTALVD